jgi:prepilin-type N-terminal cleavage/methylation domain-containing protein
MKNPSGFSLLEMMIAVGILTIVALGLSGYMSNLAKQQQAAQENIEIMQLKTFIHSVAIDPESIYTSGDVNTVAKATTPSGYIATTSGFTTTTSGFTTTTSGYTTATGTTPTGTAAGTAAGSYTPSGMFLDSSQDPNRAPYYGPTDLN